ncbi:MAG: class I SAM-dependent methyltransferase [Candidatus Binatia bacterium]
MSKRFSDVKLHTTFEDLRLFTDWDNRYYYPEALRFYEMAIDFVVQSLGVRPGQSILDVGCGPANHSIAFARRGISCIAIDWSQAVLEEAARRVSGAGLGKMVQLKQEDITCLSYADQSFDFIFCWGVLMHVPDLNKGVSELARVLKPGGRIAISMSNPRSAQMIAYKILRRIKKGVQGQVSDSPWMESPSGPIFVRGMTFHDLTNVLEQNHLHVLKVRAGQFADLHSQNIFLRRSICVLNKVWFKTIKTPLLASGYILIGQKTSIM